MITHDSAVFSDDVLATFKKETGITVTQVKAGDAGEMTNKLVLTNKSPIADVVYGIDNTFAGVAIDNQVIDGKLAAIDSSDVCFNYDLYWFALHEQPAPTTIDDLTKPEFRGLTVVTNPTSSSPGLAFLAATVSRFGDAGWQQYWRALKANGVKVDAGWEDAYFTDFSGSSGKGDYPIVLSYSSSPAFEIRDGGQSQTESLLDGCFKQTEYAGVIKGTHNAAGAAKFVKFLQSKAFQATLPETNYVFPIDKSVKLPKDWAEFAIRPESTIGDELNLDANRKDWFAKWNDIFSAN